LKVTKIRLSFGGIIRRNLYKRAKNKDGIRA
jgi:hypothetical protein